MIRATICVDAPMFSTRPARFFCCCLRVVCGANCTYTYDGFQSQLRGVQGRVEEVRKQYAREYRERRRLFNVVQVCASVLPVQYVCHRGIHECT